MSTIQVILLDDFPTLGKQGEIVQVKLGYAHNFLIPQKKAAVINTPEAKEILLKIRNRKTEKSKQEEAKQEKKLEQDKKRQEMKEKKTKLLSKKKKKVV